MTHSACSVQLLEFTESQSVKKPKLGIPVKILLVRSTVVSVILKHETGVGKVYKSTSCACLYFHSRTKRLINMEATHD
jgi:hypothetical protein